MAEIVIGGNMGAEAKPEVGARMGSAARHLRRCMDAIAAIRERSKARTQWHSRKERAAFESWKFLAKLFDGW